MSNARYSENYLGANIPFKNPSQTPDPAYTIRSRQFKCVFSILLLVLIGGLSTPQVEAGEIEATKSCKIVDCPSRITGGISFTLFKNQTIIWKASYATSECGDAGICRVTNAFYLSTVSDSGTDIPLTTAGATDGMKDLMGSTTGIKYFIGIKNKMGPGTYKIRFDLTPSSISVSPTSFPFDPVKKGEVSKDAMTFRVSVTGDVDVNIGKPGSPDSHFDVLPDREIGKIAAGSSATFQVRYMALDTIGLFKTRITISGTSDLGPVSTFLELTGATFGTAMIHVKAVTGLSCAVTKGSSSEQMFTVTSTGTEPVLLSAVAEPPSDDQFTISAPTPSIISSLGPASSFKVVFTARATTGRFTETIQVRGEVQGPGSDSVSDPSIIRLSLTTDVVNTSPSLDILDSSSNSVKDQELTLFVNPADPLFPTGQPFSFKLKGNGSPTFNHTITDVRLLDPDNGDADFADSGGFDVLPDPIRPTLKTVTETDLFELRVIPNVNSDRFGFPIFPHKRVKVFFKAATCAGTETASVIINVSQVFGPATNVPTISQWGLLIMSLLLMTAGTIFIGRHQLITTEPAMGSSTHFNVNAIRHFFILRVFANVLAVVIVLAMAGIVFGVHPLGETKS